MEARLLPHLSRQRGVGEPGEGGNSWEQLVGREMMTTPHIQANPGFLNLNGDFTEPNTTT